MKAFVTGLALLLVVGWSSAASAHSRERIRKLLQSEGYEDIDVRSKSSPFDVYACRDGERFRMHFDYRGNRTEETSIGNCDGAATMAAEPANPDASAKPGKKSTRQGCSRFIPAIGAVVAVECP